jgi:hypothetical protein
MMKRQAEIICLACCSALGFHFCGLAWCTHRACKPWLWESHDDRGTTTGKGGEINVNSLVCSDAP